MQIVPFGGHLRAPLPQKNGQKKKKVCVVGSIEIKEKDGSIAKPARKEILFRVEEKKLEEEPKENILLVDQL